MSYSVKDIGNHRFSLAQYPLVLLLPHYSTRPYFCKGAVRLYPLDAEGFLQLKSLHLMRLNDYFKFAFYHVAPYYTIFTA